MVIHALFLFTGLLYSFYMRKEQLLEPIVLTARPGVFVSQAQALIGFSEATTQVSNGIALFLS